MGWQQAIGTLLYDDATIQAVITNKSQISPNYISDEKTKVPFIYYNQLDNPKIDDDGQNWIRLRIWITSSNFSECESLRNAIDGIFNNGYGTIAGFTFSNTKLIDKGATPIYNTSLQRYETFADVRISYEDQ